MASLSLRDLPALTDQSAARLLRCGACGLGVVTPRPVPADLRRHYESEYLHRSETRERLSTGKERLFRWYLERLQGRRLLDVGCGEGDFVALASAAGWDAVGLELHRGAAAAGAARGVQVYEGGPEALPAGRFDVITLWNVLDQMPEPAAELAALLERLEPGGTLFVRVPNLAFHLAAWRAWRMLFPGRRAPTVFHPLVFDGASLGRFLRAQGLVDVRVENSVLTESPIPGLPGWAAGVLRPLSSAVAGLVAGLSGSRWLVAPSLVARARRA